MADVDRQALAAEEVEHRQCAEPPSIGELIGHESMLQMSFRASRWLSLLAMHGRRVAPRRFRRSVPVSGALAPII